MNDWQQKLLQAARVARLATIDGQGQPHVVPIVFAYDGRQLFTPLDGKPKRVALDRLQRVRNLAANDQATVVVDYYSEDWGQLAWVQLRGRATLLTAGERYETGLALLTRKYPQYATMPLAGRPLIVLRVERLRGWRATPRTAEGDEDDQAPRGP
jgi:coenzyme F420-0:L-glutamate ligase / coenzyme F420-1:gamma-L-glutamate ligase